MNRKHILAYLKQNFSLVKNGMLENQWLFTHKLSEWKVVELDGKLHLKFKNQHVFTADTIEAIVDFVLV